MGWTSGLSEVASSFMLASHAMSTRYWATLDVPGSSPERRGTPISGTYQSTGAR